MKTVTQSFLVKSLLLLISTSLITACDGGGGGGTANTGSSSSGDSSSSSASSSTSSGAPGAQALVVAIDSGASTSAEFAGITFGADRYFVGGSTNTTTDPISGTVDDALFQSERHGEYQYEVPVTANGRYTITLYFAELTLTSAGQRSFSVAIEGNPVLSHIDLYSLAGHDGAYSHTAENIQVNDQKVTIELIAGVEDPTLAGFAIYSSDGELDTSAPDGPVFSGDKFVGNITTSGNVRSDFIQYWDQITPENEGKWGSVEGTRDSYNWEPVDRIYAYARQYDIPVKAHTMIWGQQAPGWINNLSAADQRAEIEEWIRDYCTRYPDTAMMDVVNEAHPNHAPANYASNAFGPDWIIEVFKLARTHCPNTVLIYNDYNFLTWDTDVILDLIRPAVEAGVVDGLGMQAHSLYSPRVWTAQEIKDKLDLIGSLGTELYISEYDIEATDDQRQLEYMQMHFPVFYEHPQVVGITFWGYIYGSTWREGTGLIRDGQPRPAMTWLMEYLGR